MSDRMMTSRRRAFTLIELLVVIGIIGLLATISILALRSAREKAKISRRLGDMRQVQTALALYYSLNGQYPSPDVNQSCSGWDAGNREIPFLEGRLPGIMDSPPNESFTGGCSGYNYYRYPAGSYGCDPARGAYYVLGIRGTGQAYPESPGWACPDRSWNAEFDWVAGMFEK